MIESSDDPVAHRAGEAPYRYLFEHMLNGCAHCRMLFEDGRPADFVYLTVNAAFEELTGLKHVVGKRVTEVIPGIAQAHPELFEIYGRVARTGQPEKFELYLKPLGIWLAISVSSPQEGDFVAVFDNVTARKEAETHLRESEARYALLAEASQDQIFIVDREGRFSYANAITAGKLQRRPEDLIGKRLSDCFPPETVAQQERELAKVVESRATTSCVVPLQFGTSEEWVQAWLVPQLDERGEVQSILGVARDITERHRLTMLLERQSRLLAAVIDAAPVGISILLGDRFVHELVNPALERLAPGTPLLGVPFADAWPHMAGRLLPVFARVIEDGEPREIGDVESLAGSESKCLSMAIARVHLPEHSTPSIVLMATDMTGHKQLEAQFQQAQKMEAVGRLAGGIAHDFNNLLTAVLGYTELVTNTMRQEDPRRTDLDEVRKAAESAATLTRQLLTFSRRRPVDRVVIDANTIVTNLERIIRRTIGEDVGVALQLDTVPCRITVDPGQVEQVVMNLCVNARDAMPRGGTVTLGTRCVELGPTTPSSTGSIPAGQYVSLFIRDTGVGMSAEVKSHLFEPFFTTKELGKGTGLGLSTVYGIVRQCHGHVAVESEPDRGTTFNIYFPHAGQPEGEVGLLQTDRVDFHGTETILVVEDNESLRRLAGKLLSDLGYSVLTVGDAYEALRIVDTYSQPIHLVLTDVVMPGIDGYRLGHDILARRPETRILHMSGYTGDRSWQYGSLETDKKLLRKPFDRAMLGEKVREALGGHDVPRDSAGVVHA